MSTFVRISVFATRRLSVLLTFIALASLCPSAFAQTAPQLLPYTAKLIAGGGTATIGQGAICPVSGFTSTDAYGDGCLATEIQLVSPRYALRIRTATFSSATTTMAWYAASTRFQALSPQLPGAPVHPLHRVRPAEPIPRRTRVVMAASARWSNCLTRPGWLSRRLETFTSPISVTPMSARSPQPLAW